MQDMWEPTSDEHKKLIEEVINTFGVDGLARKIILQLIGDKCEQERIELEEREWQHRRDLESEDGWNWCKNSSVLGYNN